MPYDLKPPSWIAVGRTVRADGSVISVREKPEPALVPVEVPDPKHIKFTTTVYDRDGKPDRQFVRIEADAQERERLWRQFADTLAKDLPQVKPVPPPKTAADDLCAEIPIGDHHYGMYAWWRESGDDYDIKVAESLLYGAIDHFMALGAPAATCLIESLGDFLHYDGMTPETVRSKHRLDSDTRFQKMLEVAMTTFRHIINTALKRYRAVHVIVAGGNHDPASSAMIRTALGHIYEREPRVTIDQSPGDFFYFEFGKCLIGVNHGHQVKMEDLPLIMAEDQPERWGRTLYRHWRTGHIHHARQQIVLAGRDHKRTTVESFRVLPPNEAYATQAGFRSLRDMKMIMLHREFGEQARYTYNPRMLAHHPDVS